MVPRRQGIAKRFVVKIIINIFYLYFFRYNCNRYNEDDAKKARDSQEVCDQKRMDLVEANGENKILDYIKRKKRIDFTIFFKKKKKIFFEIC